MAKRGLTRRTFLSSSAAAATIFATGCGSSDTLTPAPGRAISSLTKDDFSPLVTEGFQLVHPVHGSAPVTLAALVDHSTNYPPGPGERDPFTLAFTGDAATAPESDMYTLVHGSLGSFTLYLFRLQAGVYDIHFN